MDANLALRAITLCGIGSYLHGSRLDIKPLTILCGTNGSGKSTWLKAINILNRSLDRPDFPFSLSFEDNNFDDLEFTNAAIHLSDPSVPEASYKDQELKRNFGLPGTIGLEFEATSDFELSTAEHDDVNRYIEMQKFFWLGKCSKGTRFQVRISHPTTTWESSTVCGLRHMVELRVNEEYVICFEGIDDIDSGNSETYSVKCSAEFVPGITVIDEAKLIELAHYQPSRNHVSEFKGVMDECSVLQVVETAITRFRELLSILLSGFFDISAIRVKHDYSDIMHQDPDRYPFDGDEVINSRHVGLEGEATWWLQRQFAYMHMDPISECPPHEDYLFEGFVAKWLETLLDNVTIVIDEGHNEDGSLLSRSRGWGDAPTGYLRKDGSNLLGRDRLIEIYEHHYAGFSSASRIGQKCFGYEPTSPRQMSSGFHQLLPLIVQAGLMWRFEVMAVENPEVHLHPSLQLRVAEFLMHQAKSGKYMLIETHSDLIIRRVLREILEEKIALGQANIGIYFASLDKLDETYGIYQCSSLERIEIDDHGRIKNWPEGFMDDDVKESRRLMSIMYGGNTAGEDDEQ
ncbi:DUF3696 domain-containing protein [Bythopirellula goksoeyrii]|uniref:AAA domain-containing protein n=1 Tax=Bythopirellula goksoeyrii TaxID=1400387 RepID=A0A5B9QGW1_9BACT|nr:DUF3696 domain-containing protein [Bythopirellula goksoeyrii]QEG36885.1 hypothetical protein Pr1d_42220 [Bythopirellula goksoeyrii]